MPHAPVTPSQKPDRRRIDRSPLTMACACAHRPSREIARMPAAAVHGSRLGTQSGTASLVANPAEFCGSRVHLAFSCDRGADRSKARALAEGQRNGNHGALTSLWGGPCNRGNLCRRRPGGQGRRAGQGGTGRRRDRSVRVWLADLTESHKSSPICADQAACAGSASLMHRSRRKNRSAPTQKKRRPAPGLSWRQVEAQPNQ